MSGKYAVLLCASCVIGDYGPKYHVGDVDHVIEGPTQELVVGGAYHVEASGNRDLEISVSADPYCRRAVFGDNVASQEWQRDRRSGLDMAMYATGTAAFVTGMIMLAAGVSDSSSISPTTGAIVGLSGVYLDAVGLSRVARDSSYRSGREEVGRQHGASTWSGPAYPCRHTNLALAPRSLKMDVALEHGGSYWRRVTSDASGHITIPGFVADAATVAADCGDAVVTITDESTDAVEADEARTGSPEHVDPFAVRARLYRLTVAGRSLKKRADLPQIERGVAERCHQYRVTSCEADVDNKSLRSGCEDSCARSVDVTRCVLAERHCEYEAPDADECVLGYAACLEYSGVDDDDLRQCTERCIDDARHEECQ